jgi:hypothetical protein
VRGEKVGKKRKIIDPYAGPCQTDTHSLWLLQTPPDTAIYAIDNGFVPYRPDQDTLQERYLVGDTFYAAKNNLICLWVQMHGLLKNDKVRVEWYTPGNKLWNKQENKCHYTSWYTYSWCDIDMPAIKGKWLAKYYVNKRLIVSRNFYII